MDSNRPREILSEWRESAPYWTKHADDISAMFAPITVALCAAAEVREGLTVLDVAGGSGEPSIPIASKLGSSGLVVCSDVVLEMLEGTRRQARLRSLANLEFVQCSAGSLPFADRQFEAVTCRLGIMLFDDPKAAAREMLRVVKPGHIVACAVWARRETNPFFHVVTDVVSRYVYSPPEDPNSPGAFRYSESGKLAQLFAEAGGVDISERYLDFTIEAQLSPRDFWQLRVELSDTLRTKVAVMTKTQLDSIRHEIEGAVGSFFVGNQMRFPARVLLVLARRT